MRIIGIIPARMASSRFPNKPMAAIHGIPMVGHCYLRCKMCPLLDEVYVATCDQVVVDYIASIGGRAIMTADTHVRASDRVAEAMLKIEAEGAGRTDVVVMIQGDEPMVTPAMLAEAIEPMRREPEVQVLNLMGRITSSEDHDDPNEIKVVVDHRSEALYFSREPVPTRKKSSQPVPMLKQICIIPFRRDFLLKFNSLPQLPLEIAESIDMLRCLEYGYKVRMVMTEAETCSVDTPDDLREAEEAMQADELLARYRHKAAR